MQINKRSIQVFCKITLNHSNTYKVLKMTDVKQGKYLYER